jgi:hypothetical protein
MSEMESIDRSIGGADLNERAISWAHHKPSYRTGDWRIACLRFAETKSIQVGQGMYQGGLSEGLLRRTTFLILSILMGQRDTGRQGR